MKTRTIEHTFDIDQGIFIVTATITPPLPATYLDPPEPVSVEIEHVECPDPGIDPDRIIEILGGEDTVIGAILEECAEREERR